MRHYLKSLIIICLVLASVSPACKFISGGKSFFEICSDFGAVENLSIPEELIAYFPGLEQEPVDPEHLEMGIDCAFCFAQSHANAFLPSEISLNRIVMSGAVFIRYKTTELRHELRLYQPRGPPVDLV